MVEPTILKAVEGVEQRHVKKADHLSNGVDREQADNHSLNEKEGLEEEIEQHVCNNLADTREGLGLATRNLKCQVSYVLEPDGIDYLAEHK